MNLSFSGVLHAFSALLMLNSACAEKGSINFMLFFGAQDIGFWSAVERGYFDKRNLQVDYTYASKSFILRKKLADGSIDLGYAAADNAVHMTVDSTKEEDEAVILTGGDSSMNSFIVQPAIQSISDMENQTLIVDFPTTAFALQDYKVLATGGLEPVNYTVESIGSTRLRYEAMTNESNAERYDGTSLNIPFSIMATEQDGLTNLGRIVDIIGQYQSSSLFATKSWLASDNNEDKVVRFIAAWIEGLRWAMDSENKDAVLEILERKLGTVPEITELTYDAIMEPGFGLERDMKFLVEGFQLTLKIREEFVGGGPFDQAKLVDLSYHTRALDVLGAGDGEKVTSEASIKFQLSSVFLVLLLSPAIMFTSICM